MKKFALVLFTLLIKVSVSHAFEAEISSFYKKPTLENFHNIFDVCYQEIENESNPSKKDFEQIILEIFIKQVRHKYPTYLKANEDQRHSDAEIISILKTQIDHESRYIAYLWTSFYATGEPVYLEQIIRCVSDNPLDYELNIYILSTLKTAMQEDETINTLIHTISQEKPELTGQCRLFEFLFSARPNSGPTLQSSLL